ncbi:tRNA preQ1(34) S-adenosylmethionine ribosyltransferase-isomerase QueA [Candidatus Peregrinibacteria bacterium]|nr:tRNA preQ1(34) S-adenosylmethionine ribosyltransferase-isomerase QueA [Candidatus Peregrinibacteria bacterium]
MKLSDFDFELDEKFIAQCPSQRRDESKLLIYDTLNNLVSHKSFSDIVSFLGPEHVLVMNQSKVVPARILFENKEIFLLKRIDEFTYVCMVRPGRFFKKGKTFSVNDVECHVEDVLEDGTRVIKFSGVEARTLAKIPLPPYIKNENVDLSRYQTVYANEEGSVAAPTAGLHFTKDLLKSLHNKGVNSELVTLHVGRGTFLPVKTSDISEHSMHEEEYEISESTAGNLNSFMQDGKKIVAVGTTSVRVLESNYKKFNRFRGEKSTTDIFIYPGSYKWKAVDSLITNFHLPKSTLIMLVASFLEHKGVKDPISKIMELYEIAKTNNYRFFSFGDSMFIF